MEHEHKAGGPLDYNYIADGIYAGTNQCCALGLAEVLKKEGITADISLEDVSLDHPYGVSMYAWIPTADDTPPTQDQLMFGVRTLEEIIKQKRKVYVHCKNGHGRTTTLVSAYLIYRGATPEKAISLVKAKRLTVHLQDSQRQALEEFAASVLSTR
ncbi:dual specificity protein phosphatase family protein [Candidatus Kaiserbacteria bacterium]|nr:dual specificity protein phosphatase family protein [Candidatus Kaiserbacteria bacterium]